MTLPHKTSVPRSNLLQNTCGSGSNLLRNKSGSRSNLLQNFFGLVNFVMFFLFYFSNRSKGPAQKQIKGSKGVTVNNHSCNKYLVPNHLFLIFVTSS